ncbi:MAG: hypothetical protein ACRCYX_00870 [Dermatophilaceae bacterium]
MADDYDEQLIEATRVRRDRLTEALLHGPQRLRRVWSDRVGTHLAGAFVAVLAGAVCVAVAFVAQVLENDPTIGRSRTVNTVPGQSGSSASPSAPSARPTPTRPPSSRPAPRPTLTRPPSARPTPTRPPSARPPSSRPPSARPPSSRPAPRPTRSSPTPTTTRAAP